MRELRQSGERGEVDDAGAVEPQALERDEPPQRREITQRRVDRAQLAEAGEPSERGQAVDLRSGEIEFLRIKNSWGMDRPDRWVTSAVPGYHDLYTTYLNGPVKRCEEKDGHTDTSNCKTDITPFTDVVLPAGY